MREIRRDEYCMLSLYVESKKYNKPVNITTKTKKKQTYRYREQTNGSQWEREGESDSMWAGDKEVQSIMHQISCKNILYNRDYSQYFITINGV